MSVESVAESIPPGYKQTEVGVIPEDWEVKSLNRISPAQCVGLVINPSSYFDDNGTVPILVGSNIKENCINWESAKRITNASNEMLVSSQLVAGDLVTVRVGEPGITAVVPPELDRCNCASMMIVRQHNSFNSQWLCYLMNSQIGLSQVKHVQYGTAQKQFNISDAIYFSYPFPPLPEQEAIATALSDTDAFIESLEQLIAKKHQIKQGTMQELLTGKRRLPGFRGEWKVKEIQEISDVDIESLTATTQPNYEFKYISLEEVDCGTLKGWTEYIFATAPSRARRKIRKGDVLISTVRPNLQSHCLIKEDWNDFVCSTGFSVLRCKSELANPYYVFAHFFSSYIERQIEALISGSNYPAINSSDVKKLKIPLPPSLEEQAAIATILADMDSEITSLEEKLVKTRQIKQGMMQELLTGRIRLV